MIRILEEESLPRLRFTLPETEWYENKNDMFQECMERIDRHDVNFILSCVHESMQSKIESMIDNDKSLEKQLISRFKRYVINAKKNYKFNMEEICNILINRIAKDYKNTMKRKYYEDMPEHMKINMLIDDSHEYMDKVDTEFTTIYVSYSLDTRNPKFKKRFT